MRKESREPGIDAKREHVPSDFPIVVLSCALLLEESARRECLKKDTRESDMD